MKGTMVKNSNNIKEDIDKYGVDVVLYAVHKEINPQPLTKEQVFSSLDSMFPQNNVIEMRLIKEQYGDDIFRRKEAMKYFWNELKPNLLNGHSTIHSVAVAGKYWLAKYNFERCGV